MFLNPHQQALSYTVCIRQQPQIGVGKRIRHSIIIILINKETKTHSLIGDGVFISESIYSSSMLYGMELIQLLLYFTLYITISI